jgi:hypothetical protein
MDEEGWLSLRISALLEVHGVQLIDPKMTYIVRLDFWK